jgi:hypothetical protein
VDEVAFTGTGRSGKAAFTLGARRASVGRPSRVSWVVAEPEGNEFCVLRPL